MDEKQLKLLKQLADGRMAHALNELAVPVLRAAIDSSVERLCIEFKSSGTASLATVGYIAACKDLIANFEQVANVGNRAHARLESDP